MNRLLVATVAAFLLVGPARAESLAVKYLYEGNLVEGEKALLAQLTEKPSDDEARLGLATIQFFSAVERIGTDLHKYGFRTRSSFLPLPPEWRKMMPENAKPERFTYLAFRQMVQKIIDNANKIDATLAKIKDPKVKLPVQMAKVRINLFGQGKMVNISMFIEALGMREEAKLVEKLPITFDYSDVAWLRGYCNFAAGAGESILALDLQPVHRTLAHRLFRNPDTMTAAQLTEFEKKESASIEKGTSDMSFSAFLRKIPVTDPARLKRALAHFEAMMGHSIEMWTRILAETDDDNEWIPRPGQRGAFGSPVTAAMVRIMQTTLTETRDMLKGTKVLAPPSNPLLQLLGGDRPNIGVNIRKMFTNPPRVIDVPGLIGPALAPYITPGTPSELTGQPMIDEISRVFPGRSFLTFGARTN